jgi:transposase-like protein
VPAAPQLTPGLNSWLRVDTTRHWPSAHPAEVYGADVSVQTISTITDRVVEGMAVWQNRPLDPGRCIR